MMESKEIREKFLSFFKNKQHEVVPSAPMVIKNDPTLMFTNAGMNQFKDYFLGDKEPSSLRITDTQKCLRVSGKHNDLEEVGIDTYHHTMFEMLGNWSFGDYFKKEAIQWSWELLVDVFKLPEDRLYATVFQGDESDGLSVDTEAVEIWKGVIPEDRILEFSKKDNFWEMGETGPCGPCSEIHIDLRSEDERAKIPGNELVNADHPQVIEIWNLVFMQYNRFADGKLKELPQKHIDTGMGLERLVRVIQGKNSNYDTDIFMPLINYIGEKSGFKYGKDEKVDIAIRVIVDHIRAVAFAIADAQLPSNTGAGYVIRRILRRAVRYGYTFLNFNQPFIHELIPVLCEKFDGVFDELTAQKDFIAKVIEEEEASFLRTLDKGLKILEELFVQNKETTVIPGDKVFELYDTYGFPLDLTELIARENNFSIDRAGFKSGMDQQKNRSRTAATSEASDWINVKSIDNVQFVGYEALSIEAEVVKYREIKTKGTTNNQIVLTKTPFYAESGGQVGDTGTLVINDETIKVLDTKKENDLIIHFCDRLPKDPKGLVKCEVDRERRSSVAKNHSATHLLQAALVQTLGAHIAQKGSLVNENILRFDFSHFSKLTNEEIKAVEDIVNSKIRENIVLDEARDVPIKEAIDNGATALFGEKYGDKVRVITFDKNYSVELCGGTHVSQTGNIGVFKIISESSIAAGVRRIEAITGQAVLDLVDSKFSLLEELKEVLKQPKDIIKSVQSLIDERSVLSKKVEAFQVKEGASIKENLKSNCSEVNGINVIIEKIKVGSADTLKQLSFQLKSEIPNLFLVLAANIDEKPMISVTIDEKLCKTRSLNAGNIVRELASEIKGGGGGQPFFATAGGKDLSGLDNVVTKALLIPSAVSTES